MSIFKKALFAVILLTLSICCGNKKSNSETLNEKMPQIECVAIDLGLPSGTLWAESNLGATSCEEPGYFFYWGDVNAFEPGARYKYVNDCYYDGGCETMYLKYVTNKEYGQIDGLTELEQSDDAAAVLVGDGWGMPTVEDIDELFEHCTWKLDNRNNQDGITFVGPNGNTLFLPYHYGYWPDRGYYLGGSDYIYWSKSLATGSPWDEYHCFDDRFGCGIQIRIWDEGTRAEKNFNYRAMPGFIRPVRHK